MPEISIIVPVYKVEKYLDKCIESILNQTFKDFELILVDDGSPDRCGEMCDEYAKKDSRIVSVHKENGGLSDARNYGIDISNGKYIGFVDSDDYIEADMYETLYNNIIENDADVSVCGMYQCYQNNFYRECKTDEFFVVGGKEALKMALEGIKFSVPACNKIYKKEIITKNKYPVGKLSEDAFVTPKLLAQVNKVVVTTEPKYYYVHRENSITCSEFKMKDFDVVDAYKMNLDFVMQNYPELEPQAMFRYLWAHMYVLDKIILSKNLNGTNEYKNVVNFLKKNAWKIITNPCFTRNRKIATIALLINKNIYKKLVLTNNQKSMKAYS